MSSRTWPAAATVAIAIWLGATSGLVAQQPPDTLWRPESGVAMLAWDSVLTMRAEAPIDTVEVPFALQAVFRFAEPVDSFVVYRDGVALDSIWARYHVDWSGEPIWQLWPVSDRPGAVRTFEVCGTPGSGSQRCGSVALRYAALPSTRLATPRDTIPELGRRVEHRGSPFMLGVGDGFRIPRDSVDVRPGDVLGLEFALAPDSVTPGETRGRRTTDMPWPFEPPYRWSPELDPGEVRVVWICSWWGRANRRCDHVALRDAR